MSSFRDSQKIVIAGASSLLGAELKSLLEESRFAAADFRLVDEEVAAGTLTEAGGEAAVIQPVEADSFSRASYVFFAGSAEFTRRNLAAAKNSGAKVIDLAGGVAGQPETASWFPKLDVLQGRELVRDANVFSVPSAAATSAAALTLVLSKIGLRRMSVLCFQSVSEAGRAGIEELESQTGQLLSFTSVGQPVFDTQVAFNLLDRYGAGSAQKLDAVRERIVAETRACVQEKAPMPALQIVHAPVFYGTVFSACAELEASAEVTRIMNACTEADFALIANGEAGPSNVSAAGEKIVQLANPEADRSQPGTWWFWGAADNIRLPAANAVKLAEILS